MHTLYNILAVFAGSGLGGVCRWGVSTMGNGHYPLGTLTVNVLGCFLIGLLTRLTPGNETMKLLLVTGFCGGFTTFSTFINENFLLLRGSQLALSALYLTLSIVLGFLGAWLGYNLLSVK